VQDEQHFGPQPQELAGTLQSMLLRVEETRPEPVDHRTLPRGALTPRTLAAPHEAGMPHIQTT
jgi:hypothetical protein